MVYNADLFVNPWTCTTTWANLPCWHLWMLPLEPLELEMSFYVRKIISYRSLWGYGVDWWLLAFITATFFVCVGNPVAHPQFNVLFSRSWNGLYERWCTSMKCQNMIGYKVKGYKVATISQMNMITVWFCCSSWFRSPKGSHVLMSLFHHSIHQKSLRKYALKRIHKLKVQPKVLKQLTAEVDPWLR